MKTTMSVKATLAAIVTALALGAMTSGCSHAPGIQAALLMKQQREAGEILMAKCRAGDTAACAYATGIRN